MIFAFAFFFYLFVYGQCDHATRNVVKTPSKAFWKTTKALKLLEAGKIAKQVHGNILTALTRDHPYNRLARNQFAWLYLHGPDPEVQYDSEEVRNALFGPERFPFVTSMWPNEAFGTNLMFGKPLQSALGNRFDNSGHPEHMLLPKLETMRLGFKERYGDVCPIYAILGTVRDPCNFPEDKMGCAFDIIEAKEEFTQDEKCPLTDFMLYVHRNVDPRFQVFWDDTKALMEKNNIGVISGSDVVQ